MHALGLLLPYAKGREANNTGIRTFLVRKRGRPSVALALGFSLIACFILILIKSPLGPDSNPKTVSLFLVNSVTFW